MQVDPISYTPIRKSHYPFFANVNQTFPIVKAFLTILLGKVSISTCSENILFRDFMLKNYPITNYTFFANVNQTILIVKACLITLLGKVSISTYSEKVPRNVISPNNTIISTLRHLAPIPPKIFYSKISC